MTSLSRWRSVRDRTSKIRGRILPFSADLYGGSNRSKKSSGQEVQEIEKIQKMISGFGIELPHDNIKDVLRGRYAGGDGDRAFDLLMKHDEAICGIVKEMNPRVQLLGAENNGKVTCYLDSLLFCMFARLDAFEAMLYNIFDDEPRRKMSTMLRLWVNLLRSGRLVTSDIMQLLQNSIAECGWPEAASVTQQDASEAFTFITEKLNLPLLTLKMDVAHGGKEAADDDHRFVSERLLNLAIPDVPEGQSVKLEQCLESYFSNRIEVRRELERRATIDSAHSFGDEKDIDKADSTHIETTDLGSNPSTPVTPTPVTPVTVRAPPVLLRRATASSKSKGAGSAEEAMVPAWCFFSVLPFYTEGLPNEQQSFAQHFATKRPVIGVCLKRYAWTAQGSPIRKATKVIVPLEIPLPQFVSDDEMDASAPIYGNFKLVLKGAVCHRGKSVWSGHYIALVRGDLNPDFDNGRWLRFDDLASERVTYVDVTKALAEETPYLLFYQVAPIDQQETSAILSDEAASGRTSVASLASSFNEKKIPMPEIFAPAPEESRTPPPEYSATPPLTPGQRPMSRGYLEPESAERRGRDDGNDSSNRRSTSLSRRIWKSSSKEGVKDKSPSVSRLSMDDGRREGMLATPMEKRDKRSSMPTLSLLTGRKSSEWRRELEELGRKDDGKDKDGEQKPEKVPKKAKSKDSPTWGGRKWTSSKDKKKEKGKEKEKEKEKPREGEIASAAGSPKGGSSETEDIDSDLEKSKLENKGKGKDKTKGASDPSSSTAAAASSTSSSWKRISKFMDSMGSWREKGDKIEKTEKVEKRSGKSTPTHPPATPPPNSPPPPFSSTPPPPPSSPALKPTLVPAAVMNSDKGFKKENKQDISGTSS